MTVYQFLQDKYIGKKCKLQKREIKNIDGIVSEAEYPITFHLDGYFKDWTTRYNKGEEFYFRDVVFEDKIVEIKRFRNYWIFKTLNGYSFRFGNYDELPVF